MIRQDTTTPLSRIIYLAGLTVLFMCLTVFIAKWGGLLFHPEHGKLVRVVALAHLPGLTTVMAAGWMVGRRRDPSAFWQVWTAVVAIWSLMVTLFVEVL